ncbi:CCA tRNA nucleotidyltransferase [Candidatus Uhrbacteria bacterium]|nr:CCA tRNA nucleotidyltransferase [Candidatus Uhrbacteria bacterium]
MKKTFSQKKKTMPLLRNPQFGFVRALCREFPLAEVFLVGGAVRDMLLSRPTKDYDFVVRNVPITALLRFFKKHGTVRLVGKKFGILKFLPKMSKMGSGTERGQAQIRFAKLSQTPPEPDPVFDIALPRTEHTDAGTGHYRDFQIKTDHRLPIEEDLSRRDFTINALALNLKTREVIDPFGGVADIKKKIIRTVGKPQARFAEDYSRILRAVRFACQLGFQIEQETLEVIRKKAKFLNKEMAPEKRLTKKIDRNTMRVVAYEIIAREIVKTFVADPVRALDMYDDLGIIKLLIPELLTMKGCPQEKRWHSEGDVWTHTRLALSVLAGKKFANEFGEKNNSALLTFAVLFHDAGKPSTLQTPETHGTDRIRTHGHDRAGAEIARHVADRLRLASAAEFDGTADDLAWLVRNHLLVLTTTVDKLRSRTIEKYFYDDPRRGALLQRLVFCDSSASIQESGRVGIQGYYAFKKRRHAFEKQHNLTLRKHALPPPLLDGDAIMRICAIKPGPRVGELRELLREEQLSGRIKTRRQAGAWLRCNGAQS